MQLTLRANAATTPKTRAYIQASTASVAELAAELGLNETTIRRWRGRQTTEDHSSRPKHMEEELVCALRIGLDLPLDDIVEVMHRCVNPKLSRSATHRCPQRHGISSRPKPAKPSSGRFEAGIKHRLAKPFHPQTNGMVERFNRHISEAIGRERKRGAAHSLFANHANRDAFLNKFANDYNHTRLKCLSYLAPKQAIANLAGHNTKAGISTGACRCVAKLRRWLRSPAATPRRRCR